MQNEAFVKNLIDTLNKATEAYDAGNPIMSDKEWDDLYFQLEQIESNMNYAFPNSPTQTIHYKSLTKLSKINHNHPMLSLDKTKRLEIVNSFLGNKQYVIMMKMDGLTCSLRYLNGELVSAETRGNGYEGEDVLHNAMIIPSIPKHIDYKEELIIDGEIICTYKDFEQFKNEFTHPRNFASGSIRLLDNSECSKRHLSFVSWDVIKGLEDTNLLSEKLQILNKFGFLIVPHIVMTGEIHNEDIIDEFKTKAQSLYYPIDGLVFKFNDIAYGKSLGQTEHHFKNAIAFKFYDETYSTSLIDIIYDVSRNGILTPVAVFDPVEIDGTIIEKASLHNLTIIKKLLNIPYKGQCLEIYKANQIIPQIASAGIPESRADIEGITIDIPKVCPICGHPTEITCEIETEVLNCTNSNCEGKLINKLVHFCSKKGMDIKGLSKATLDKLLEWNWVGNYKDIFELKQHRLEWITKPGFGPKSVDNILNSIENSRTCELSQFIAALGIPLIGASAAKDLSKEFKTWHELICAIESNYKFYTLPNFGNEMHQSIKMFDYEEAKEIADKYIIFNSIIEEKSSHSLEGNVFVITGTVKRFKNRDEIKNKIEALGGKVTGSVSKNTTYLINNDVNSTSSKNKTAKLLNIPIISEEEFIQIFGII